MSITFRRKEEDFICENCGIPVKGNGYTNHCSVCLWSKHVDINPGDRAATCLGMMQPIDIVLDGQDTYILHRCVICGYLKRNKRQDTDNFDTVLEVRKNS